VVEPQNSKIDTKIKMILRQKSHVKIKAANKNRKDNDLLFIYFIFKIKY
jgi:hypothetical protein